MIKKRILFILPSLKSGGAEKNLSFIANSIDKEYDVKLLILGYEKDAVFNVSNTNVIYLNKKRLLYSIFSIFKLLGTEKPDIVFSSISHINNLMAVFSFYFKEIKFIAREASVISTMKLFSGLKSKINFKLISLLYPKLDMIICQSIDMKNDFIKNFNIQENRLKIIHNPITRYYNEQKSKKNDNKIKFLTIGRLSKEKGYDRLLNILSKINYKFDYTIIGDGPESSNLKMLTKSLNLEKKVKFINYSSKIFDELNKADVYLQGSYVEGFPNALLESCTVGTPVLAFKCPGGTREIIQNGINGYLVNDEEQFLALLSDKSSLSNFNSTNIIESVLERFSSKKIISQYQKLFNSL